MLRGHEYTNCTQAHSCIRSAYSRMAFVPATERSIDEEEIAIVERHQT